MLTCLIEHMCWGFICSIGYVNDHVFHSNFNCAMFQIRHCYCEVLDKYVVPLSNVYKSVEKALCSLLVLTQLDSLTLSTKISLCGFSLSAEAKTSDDVGIVPNI